MAYKRKTYRKKKHLGKATLALKKVKHLEKVLKPEVKQRYTYLAGQGVNDTFTVFSIFHDIAQGLATNERIGNEVLVKRIRARSYIRLTNSVAGQMVALRCVVLQFVQQTPGVQPPSGYVLGSALGSFMDYTTDETTSATGGNYVRILYDRRYSMSMSSKPNLYIDVDIKRDIKLQYTGPGGTAIQKNGLYIYFVSDSPLLSPSINPIADTVFLTDFTDV